MAEDREIPKATSTGLSRSSKNFQVKRGDFYDHFSIVLGERQGNFVGIEKMPKVLEPGYMAIGNSIYEVSIQDLIRRKINVSREPVNIPTISRNAPRSSSDSLSAILDKGDSNNRQSLPSSVSEFQIDQNVNMAWKNQIESIFHLEDPEADWEFVEDSSQPEQYNESSAA